MVYTDSLEFDKYLKRMKLTLNAAAVASFREKRNFCCVFAIKMKDRKPDVQGLGDLGV